MAWGDMPPGGVFHSAGQGMAHPRNNQLEAALGGAAYGMLFVLGMVAGVVGGFSQDWYIGEVPISAIVWVVVLFVLCLGAGRLMRTKLAATCLAIGWLLVSMVLSMKLAAGDLVIQGDLAGVVYLYGGMAAIVAAFLLSPSSGTSWLLRGSPSR